MFVKMITGYFVGESSKKRLMGLIVGFVLSLLFWQDVVTLELFECIMSFVLLWTVAAFSAKLTNLQQAVINSKI